MLGISMRLSAQVPAAGSPASQHSQSLLFAGLPDSVLLEAHELQALINQELHAVAQVRFSPSFSLQGKIVSAARNTDQQWSSVVLKASNRLGAVFTLSSMRESNGTTAYTGRILSRMHADAYELVHHSNQYYLVKREHSDLVEE
jgi:hypothetical protein